MQPPHMKPEDFVALGQRALEELAGYWRLLPERPVLCPLSPGDVLRQLPAHPPETGLGAGADVGAAWEAVWSDVQRTILPGLTHWQSPGFYAFFPANISGPAVLGELLCAGLGVQGMLWATSPACTELEMRVMDWLAEMLGLPGAFFFRNGGPGGGVIQGTASEAAVAALAAARARAKKSAAKGTPFRPVVYITGQTHSSLVKAAMVTGIAEGPEDREAVRIIATDANLAMRADALRDAIAADRAQGRTPLFVCVTIGTRARRPSTRSRRSRRRAARAGPRRGCTWTRRTRARRASARSSARGCGASSTRIRSASTRTSGC